jgi:hypothetical protein
MCSLRFKNNFLTIGHVCYRFENSCLAIKHVRFAFKIIFVLSNVSKIICLLVGTLVVWLVVLAVTDSIL